jgi:hypothetical protein
MIFCLISLQIDLHHWSSVLNKIDEALNEIISSNSWIYLSEDNTATPEVSYSQSSSDVVLMKLRVILKFSKNILLHALNKDIYNSAEVKIDLEKLYYN